MASLIETVNITQAMVNVEECFEHGITPFLISQPGLGKTQGIRDLANKLDMQSICFLPNNYQPTDLIGLPVPNHDTRQTVHYEPEVLPKSGRGIFFIDEMAQASTAMMNALSQLLLEKKIGKYPLPEDWVVVGASNRKEDRAGTNKIPSQLNDRVCFIHIHPDSEEWGKWAIRNNVHPIAIAYVDFNPSVFNNFDGLSDINCTPRSYTMAAKLLGTDNPNFKLIQGLIGKVNYDLAGFFYLKDQLPDIEGIKQGRVKTLPDKLELIYMLSNLLIPWFKEEACRDNITNYILQMGVEHQTNIFYKAISYYGIGNRTKYYKQLSDTVMPYLNRV